MCNYKLSLKLLGDRILFIIVALLFRIPLFFLSGDMLGVPNLGNYLYSLLTLIPYAAVLFADMRDAGERDVAREDLLYHPGKGFLTGLLAQAPSLVLWIVLLSGLQFDTVRMVYNIWNAPVLHFLGGSDLPHATLMQILIPFVELAWIGLAYIYGAKVPKKAKKQKKTKKNEE